MTAVYVNGLNLQMNELALIQFNLNDQTGNIPIFKVAMTYEVLEQMHSAMAEALMQRKAKLNFIKAEGVGKGN